MEYEKKYNEAQKWIESIYSELSHEQQMEAEAFFPELKESEDERIRKEIIEQINLLKSATLSDLRDKQFDSWITWLEKQGEQKLSIEKLPFEMKTVSESLGFTSKKECDDYNKMVTNLIMSDDKGEQKPADNIQINPSEYINDMGGNGCYLKNITQKPNDKVEPKFKVGDWITDGYVGGQITSIEDNYPCYKIADFMGGINTSIPFSLQDNYHLWTIQDAKGGDVLASKDKSNILIFRNLDTSTSFSSYYNIAGKGELGWSNECFIPATKEQRDLLFQKMKEAGYEWDAEKKELKKIEQRPWSEDDKQHTRTIIRAIHGAGNITPIEGEFAEKWLKSLKDRYTWKPSDEQMEALQYVYRSCNPLPSDKLGWDSIRTLELMYQELKKLREE